jgi:hypothetical protein
MAAPVSRDFDPGRISPGETIAGGAGIALFLFLFLDWFGSLSAWKIFDVVDIILALLAILAIAIAGSRAMGNDLLGRNSGVALALSGVIATTIVLSFIFEGDERKVGVFLALLAAVALLYGGWRAMTDAPGTPGPLAGAAGAPTPPPAPPTPRPANAPPAPGGGAAGVGEGKAGPGAPHPGTSTGGPSDAAGGPAAAASAGDPVPGRTGAQTPPGLAGEPPVGGGTQPPGL